MKFYESYSNLDLSLQLAMIVDVEMLHAHRVSWAVFWYDEDTGSDTSPWVARGDVAFKSSGLPHTCPVHPRRARLIGDLRQCLSSLANLTCMYGSRGSPEKSARAICEPAKMRLGRCSR